MGGNVELVKKKRGRPRKVDSTSELIEVLKDQQKQTTQMMLEMLRVAQMNSQMLQSWFNMFKPPEQPNTTSTLEEREMSGQEDEWEPVKNNLMSQIIHGFNQEEKDFRDRMVNT